MKKILPSLLAGLAIGGAAMWLLLKKPAAEAPAAPADTAPKIEAGTAAGNSQFTTKEPVPASLSAEVRGFGRVLDPAPLVAALGEINVARVAAQASEKEYTRTKALHDNGENASLQAVETAEAVMLRDRALFEAASDKFYTAWGRALNGVDAGKLVAVLAAGNGGLVRIDLLPGDAPEEMPGAANISALTGEGTSHIIRLIGPAPVADAQAQGVSYLALWPDTVSTPAPGTALRATLAVPGEPLKVMVVPRSALVRHEGGVFVYVKSPDGGYERRLVEIARNLPDGVALAGTVVDENDKVVVSGAQQLLANEILSTLGGEE